VHHGANADAPSRDQRTAVQGSARNAVEFNGESDHIHILMSLPPNLDLSRFVNNLKTTSSLIRRDFSDHLKRVYRGRCFGPAPTASSRAAEPRYRSSNNTSNSRQVPLEPGRLSAPAKRWLEH
jgi:hypothetical protein